VQWTFTGEIIVPAGNSKDFENLGGTGDAEGREVPTERKVKPMGKEVLRSL